MHAEQRTEEWLQARVGFATASRFKDVLARLKNGEPAQARRDYLTQVVCERLTRLPTQSYTNAAMQWGVDQEPAARMRYAEKTGFQVDEVGFLKHSILQAGASPDGIVNMEGLLEIKCPTTITHVGTLINGMDEGHHAQVQGAMWIARAPWCDFVSFDPRLPEKQSLYIQRVQRDEAFIARLEQEVITFLSDVDKMIIKIRGL
jgi:hypothetical protein